MQALLAALWLARLGLAYYHRLHQILYAQQGKIMKPLFRTIATASVVQLALVPAAFSADKKDFIRVAQQHLAKEYSVAENHVKFKQINTSGGTARVFLKVRKNDGERVSVSCKVKKRTVELKGCKES
jgi:hypothetical protein